MTATVMLSGDFLPDGFPEWPPTLGHEFHFFTLLLLWEMTDTHTSPCQLGTCYTRSFSLHLVVCQMGEDVSKYHTSSNKRIEGLT